MINEEQSPATNDVKHLLERARQGDEEAFCQLLAAHEARLYQQALVLGRDAHTAEDLVAETMVEAWRSLQRFNGACRFSTWLYAILLHRSQKLVRRIRSRPIPLSFLSITGQSDSAEVMANLPDPQPNAADAAAQKEVTIRLHAALDDLPEIYREVILLRFYEDASLPEMAAALEVPVGTVKSRLHHALEKLRQMESIMNLFNRGGDT